MDPDNDHFIREGHGNDGNEGNEGNEGDEGSSVEAEDVEDPEDPPVGSCGEFLQNKDFGGSNLPGSNVYTGSKETCLDLCESTPNCNVMIRIGSGKCFLKTVSEDLEPVAKSGAVAYRICSGGTGPTVDLEDPEEEDPVEEDPEEEQHEEEQPEDPAGSCGEFLQNKDFGGSNLPGSNVYTGSKETCLDLCESTPNCNVMIRIGSGKCFLKTVSEDLEPVAKSGAVAYRICSGGTGPTVDLEDPEEEDPVEEQPEDPAGSCGEFLQNKDFGGSNLPGSNVYTGSKEACLDLCESTPNCNALIRIGSGKCYLKTISDTLEPVAKTGAVAYRICSGGMVSQPPPPPTPPSSGSTYENALKAYFTNDQCPASTFFVIHHVHMHV